MSIISSIPSIDLYTQTASQPALVSGLATGDNAAAAASVTSGQNVDAVSQDFEAVFLTQMLGAMFEGDEFSAYFGGGTAGDVYKGMLLDQYGKSFAKAGGIGIASVVKQELLRTQEIAA
jgi:Rod binding domain-containing protein